MKKEKDICPICGGPYNPGTTTITIDKGNNLIVIRKVPAMICSICGEEWIEDPISQRIEQIVNKNESPNNQFEVIN
jgi:YgiT-type zinc finger domain-containing protein